MRIDKQCYKETYPEPFLGGLDKATISIASYLDHNSRTYLEKTSKQIYRWAHTGILDQHEDWDEDYEEGK